MTVAEIITFIGSQDLTIGDLDTIATEATARLETERTAYAKLFELGDRVRLQNGEIVTVARRNVHTVTVLGSDGETRKIAPEWIVDVVDVDVNDTFDYLNVFGNHVEEDNV